ncbi:predicted protein [Nematostella vectensis]|uniref:Uncharacterized protein n=1 Tax=Nematostella vectensis TaxID=45351 RepID=A7RTF5_NEMVE|nr:predicted protein [Nematostella vectensis]|eukprot:XP_001637319.1 predicted protein [Nematostella vectensis]
MAGRRGSSETGESQTSHHRWGKVACLAAFLVQLILLGQFHCSGIIYSAMLQGYNESRANTALVLSLSASSTHAFGPITAYVTERYGAWPVGLTGSLLCCLGLLLSSFCPVLPLLYLTYSLGWGLGSCMCCRASLNVMCKYFDKYMMMNSLTWVGCALATFAISPMLQDLFKDYQISSALRIIAAVEASLVLSALIFIPFTYRHRHPVSTPSILIESEDIRDRAFGLEVFRNKRFLLWIVASCFLMLINLVPLVHIIQLAIDINIDSVNIAMLVSYLAIGSSTGRLFFGRLLTSVHRNNRIRIIQSALFLISVFTCCLPFALQDFCLALYVLLFGFFEGSFATLMPVVTVDIVGKELVPSGLSWLYTIAALPETIGPVLAGWIHDTTGSYVIAFYLFGGTSVLAILLMCWLQLMQNQDQENYTDCIIDFTGDVLPLEPQTTNSNLEVPTVEVHTP